MKLLLVDDDTDIITNNAEYLSAKGYEILTAMSGSEALLLCCDADLIVLDVGLPDIDGFALAGRLSAKTPAPILFLTARGADEDMERGFSLGYDYMRKPYSVKELSLRIDSILKKQTRNKPSVVELPPLTVDARNLTVTLSGKPVPLTPREFAILITLIETPGVMLTYSQIYERIWGPNGFMTSTVAQHVASLRRKLEECSQLRFIKTHRGIGYSFEYPPESEGDSHDA